MQKILVYIMIITPQYYCNLLGLTYELDSQVECKNP